MGANQLSRVAFHMRRWQAHPKWLLSPVQETRTLSETLAPLRRMVLDVGHADCCIALKKTVPHSCVYRCSRAAGPMRSLHRWLAWRIECHGG